MSLFPGFARLDPLTTRGSLGVDLFFILSGFILTYNYLEGFRRVKTRNYFHFLGLRLARIYPVHVFTLALAGAGMGIAWLAGAQMRDGSDFTFHTLWPNLLLIHAWTVGDNNSWNYPSWSISAEWFAYLLFPFLVAGVARLRSPAVLIAGTFAAIIAEILVIMALRCGDCALVRISGEFLAGCFLGRLYLTGWGAGRNWERSATLTMALVLLLCAVLPLGIEYRRVIIPLFAVLIFSLAYASGPLCSILSTPRAVFWGEASYALYMTHGVIERVGSKLCPMESFAHASLAVRAGVLAGYGVVIPSLAAATYLVVECPARDRIRAALDKWKPSRPPS